MLIQDRKLENFLWALLTGRVWEDIDCDTSQRHLRQNGYKYDVWDYKEGVKFFTELYLGINKRRIKASKYKVIN